MDSTLPNWALATLEIKESSAKTLGFCAWYYSDAWHCCAHDSIPNTILGDKDLAGALFVVSSFDVWVPHSSFKIPSIHKYESVRPMDIGVSADPLHACPQAV